jgi:hypothetical protein
LAAVCLAGCRTSDVDGPSHALHGTYVLQTVSGAPLPALANGAHMTDFIIVVDTLYIDGKGDGIEVMVASRPGVAGVERQKVTFKLSIGAEDVVIVNYFCPDGGLASCLAGPHHVGRLTVLGLTYESSAMYRSPMVYRRVSDTYWKDDFSLR